MGVRERRHIWSSGGGGIDVLREWIEWMRRTFVELDAELVLDVEFLRKVVLVKLGPDDVAEGRRACERVGRRGGQ